MSSILIILACTIPTAVYIGLIYRVDRYEREPIWLLSSVFLWGAIPSIILAIIGNRYLSMTYGPVIRETTNLTNSAIIAPVVEESVKAMALLILIFIRRNEIDTLLDGIIYGAMVGMGFAMVENYFYFSSEFARSGLDSLEILIFYRAIAFGLNHSLFSAIVGIGIAYGSLTTNFALRFIAPLLGFAMGMTMHGVHNASVGLSTQLCFIAPLADYSGIVVTILIIIIATRQEHKWLRTYLAEEVELGTITKDQYELVSTRKLRRAYMWGLFSQRKFVRYQRARLFLAKLSKLAYFKRRSDRRPSVEHTIKIRTTRAQIRELGERLHD